MNHTLGGGECVRAGGGGAKEPIRAGVAPTGSLNGMRSSEKAEVPERASAKRPGG